MFSSVGDTLSEFCVRYIHTDLEVRDSARESERACEHVSKKIWHIAGVKSVSVGCKDNASCGAPSRPGPRCNREIYTARATSTSCSE